MNLHHLAAFEAVARAGNVTAAAESLMISQPAVSKQVKLLERSLGTRLMERSSRGIALTEAGRELASYAKRISLLSAEAEASLGDLQSLRRGSLTIAASPTIAAYLLPQVLVRYRLKYPGIRLKVEIEQSAAIYRRLADNDSLAAALTEVEPVGEHYAFRVFMRDTFLPIAPVSHPLAKRRTASIAQFLEAGLIARDSDSPAGSFVEQALREAGHHVMPSLRLNSTEAIKEAVAAGLGVGIVSGLAVRSDLALNRMAMINVKGLSLRRPLYCVTSKASIQSKAATAFLYMLKHAARGTLPRLDRPITPAI